MKILLITTLKEVDVAVVERIESLGYHVEIVFVESLKPEYVLEAIKGRSFDYAITPGSSPYDYRCLGGRVVKGPLSLKTLPYILELVDPGRLSPTVQAEKVLDPSLATRLASRVLEDVLANATWAFDIRGLKIPLRPPPLIVASDVYLRDSVEATVMEASYRVSEGADIVVLSGSMDTSRRLYLDTLSNTMDLGVPVAADPGNLELLVDALDLGAPIAMSLTIDTLDRIPSRFRSEAVFVLVPRAMGEWRYRVEELAKAYEKAVAMGYRSLVLDPVVNPPINRGLLESLIASRDLSLKIRTPLMLGLNNAVEMMDVDTHATIGLLSILAAEAGVSIIMVGEESYKARGSTREAKLASQLASIALKLETPPKDIGLSLLQLKGKKPPEDVNYKGRGVVRIGDSLEVNCRDIDSLAKAQETVGDELMKKITEVCTPWLMIHLL